MASSLEELLEEEGFKGRKSMLRSRTSIESHKVTNSSYGSPDQRKPDSSSTNKLKTRARKSDVSRYSPQVRMERSDSAGIPRPRDYLIMRERENRKNRELLEGRRSVERLGDGRSEVHSDALSGHEIVEIGEEEGETKKDIYLSEANGPVRMETYSMGSHGRNRSRRKDMTLGMKDNGSSKKLLLVDPSLIDHGGSGMKAHKPYDEQPRRGLWNTKSFQDGLPEKHGHSIYSGPLPALDDVSIRAMVSILTGYIAPFLKYKDFRVSLQDKCISSLNFTVSKGYQSTQGEVIFNLEQAIETVERAAEDYASTKDLKRASLQLTELTGLNNSKLKDGFTCGVPNYKLSACANLYLSVIHKLHKKDRVSAKHILQVFADSPLQGRIILLPELWENFFFPHLSHLKLWYSQEVDSLVDMPSRGRKLKFLNKMYNEILDSGTQQFAVYYKDWLTEGCEAPPFPSISIPSVSIQTVQLSDSLSNSGELSNPVSTPYRHTMVSKKLYEAVFGCSSKSGAQDHIDEENYWNFMKSSGGSSVDVKHMDQHSIANSTKNLVDEELPEDGLLSSVNKGRGLLKADISLQEDKNDEGSHSSPVQPTPMKAGVRHSPQTNNLSQPKRLAISVFEPEETESFDMKVTEANSSLQEFHGSLKYIDEVSPSVPQYLSCPLTGLLFEDPVTLETGQTFERAAIRKWFDEGNKTCPVTGNSLECLTIPLTNMVIKCAIDSWKSNQCASILNYSSQMMEGKRRYEFSDLDDGSIRVMEQLVTVWNKEERIENAKHLISLGGLQYLIQRFEFGTIEEKMSAAALLHCCIEAEASCADQIAETINVRYLLELLHSKQIEARTSAVSLLIELVCGTRSKDGNNILSRFPNEEMLNLMHVLLLYLRSPQCKEQPLVAVLLLHLDLLVGPQKYSLYREEAVEAIAVTLKLSLSDENVRAVCCKALSVLGGFLSLSGKLTESWILYEAVKLNGGDEENFEDNKEHGPSRDDAILFGDEDLAHTQWLRYLLTSLLGNEKRSFLEAISNCLASKESNLVRVCLTTVALLSFALSSLSDLEFQLSAFSTLACQLKENLESGEEMEHKILASFSLLNFSKIPEFKVLLMTIAEEIASPLKSIADVTWTARQLYALISDEDL